MIVCNVSDLERMLSCYWTVLEVIVMYAILYFHNQLNSVVTINQKSILCCVLLSFSYYYVGVVTPLVLSCYVGTG